MKSFPRLLLGFGLVCVTALSALGQNAPTFTFDENGHGTDSSGAPLPSGTGVDPFSGTTTLFYVLPFSVTPGDVLISETAVAQLPSDLLRFGANNTVFVFSERDNSLPDIADVGIPTQFQTNLASIVESGPEGNNGVVWIPPAGGPGSVAGIEVQYNFISDVPEPGTLALIGMGVVATLAFRRWNRA